MTDRDRITTTLDLVREGITDGDHHKMWLIDQMVRALTGCPMVERTATDYRGDTYTYEARGESEEYLRFVAEFEDGEDGPHTYEWDEGIAP
ncbi:hypothetical protein BJF79_13690 [Actinomadura sp. CNU-125]|uniref:hypothetical protein n=1 Tax=Actinomadura sp. CNU-125 TaxID=1904961 RepID=UPI00096669B4|nr:hypothetical protein [Actinomadura sp. CNU-125]OLT24389.1 hypothetical protein BJF79_13690 [Actinomadura sp. CNU-125]